MPGCAPFVLVAIKSDPSKTAAYFSDHARQPGYRTVPFKVIDLVSHLQLPCTDNFDMDLHLKLQSNKSSNSMWLGYRALGAWDCPRAWCTLSCKFKAPAPDRLSLCGPGISSGRLNLVILGRVGLDEMFLFDFKENLIRPQGSVAQGPEF